MNSRDFHHGSAKLSASGEKIFAAARVSVKHLTPHSAKSFLRQAAREIHEAETSINQSTIQAEAIQLSVLNWALVLPFLKISKKIAACDKLILKCSQLAQRLAGQNVAAAVTFLDQTLRIAAVSVDAAANFIQHGSRTFWLRPERETIQWIDRGLQSCKSDQELVIYFQTTFLSALTTGDCLISGIPLNSKRTTLAIMCEALLGRPVKISSNAALSGCNGFNGGAATDGQNIFLPETAPDFRLFKLMALHQAILLQRYPFTSQDGAVLADPARIHLDADARLIKLLPGIINDMNEFDEDHPIDQHSERFDRRVPVAKSWWGDILPDLRRNTDETISLVKEQATDLYGEIPEELLEQLFTTLIAGGEREPDVLVQLLGEMLGNIDFTSPDSEELQENVKIFFYKEWDRLTADYKPDWCQVRQRIAREDPNDFVLLVRERLRGIILLIRKQFMKLRLEMFRKYRAQPTGDNLDIDALVQALTDMRSGAAMSENVYIRRDKRIRDVTVFFLVDLSGSTDEAIDGRRIIDIQKEALAIMAEALDVVGDPYAIYGFSSEGRFRVDMFSVKDFDEPYDEKVQYRLGNLQPAGLTRMGAVVRHAAYKLDEVSAAIKLLVLLTDGRPYDLEYGNLEYAISDTKKAIQEARNKNIHPFIITSDQKGSDYLQLISPQTECIILPKVELLPTLLPALYRRLT